MPTIFQIQYESPSNKKPVTLYAEKCQQIGPLTIYAEQTRAKRTIDVNHTPVPYGIATLNSTFTLEKPAIITEIEIPEWWNRTREEALRFNAPRQ